MPTNQEKTRQNGSQGPWWANLAGQNFTASAILVLFGCGAFVLLRESFGDQQRIWERIEATLRNDREDETKHRAAVTAMLEKMLTTYESRILSHDERLRVLEQKVLK